MDLYFEITENGYHIYDRNDSLFHIHQYEPYIPNKNLSYEENAIAQIAELTAAEDAAEEATEEDYLNALEELGVDTSEEG